MPPGENLEVDVGGEPGEQITPPGSIAKAITQEDIEQKTWLTQQNKEGIYKALAYNAYLENTIGLRDRVLDDLILNACTYGKSLDGMGLEKIIGMAMAHNQQPQTNVNIGESFTKKLGGE